MEIYHLANIHPVNMVRAEDDDQFRVMLLDKIKVLIHGVGRALEPFRPHPHLRRHYRNELLPYDRGEHPVLADMLDKGL
jgi:hypothetical protein